MLTKEDFIKFIVEGSQSSVAQKKDISEDSALPEGFDGFGFGGEETEDTATETSSFARDLMEASGFGNAQYLERSEVILGADPAAKYLPEQVYYWPQTYDRPYQTLLFELGTIGSELLKTPLFRALKGQQILEDVLSRLVQMSLRGFEQGGEKRTASVKQGRQTETLCIVSCPDDREETDTIVHVVCFGTVSADQNSLESFHIREASKYWEPQIRDDHLEKLYKRHFSKLVSDKWQNAFISGEERKLAHKLLEVCIEKNVKDNEKRIQESAVELLEEIAKSFGLRRKGGKGGRRLAAFNLPSDHDIGMDSENLAKHGGKNPFSGMTLRDEKNRLLGYIIYCLDEKKDAVELRNHLKANNRFHNVLIIYPDGDHAELELWQGKAPLAGKLTKKGAAYQGEGEVVNLLSRFFVVSKAKVKNPTELAQELAYRARYLRKLAIKELSEEDDEGPLRKLYKIFKESLVHDQTEEEFADAFAQTLTYGLLTARWMGSEQLTKNGERFTRQNALQYLPKTSNFLSDLFETALSLKSDENRGRLLWLVDDIANLLDRINVNYVFGVGDECSDENTDPVIHFYEPFLAAYDNELRNKRGVYFTPNPVVFHIVRGVHEILQNEFFLEDGLASTDTWQDVKKKVPNIIKPDSVNDDEPFVRILDPATGTGTFLYECIGLIEKTMKEKWCAELSIKNWDHPKVIKRWRRYVEKHLLQRIYGFELMVASYSIAHLKLAFKLAETGCQYEKIDHLNIYLTNSLERPQNEQIMLPGFASPLAKESQSVSEIKLNVKFTVILGNPPYAGHSINKGKWAKSLIEKYRFINQKKLRLAQGKWLQNDYIKFIALSESILSKSRAGVLGMITDHSYLDGDTFPGLRHSLLKTFSRLKIINLQGNLNRRETPPNGVSVDENVFDIQQGVAIIHGCILPKEKDVNAQCCISSLWGDRKTKFNILWGKPNIENNFIWKTLEHYDDRYFFVDVSEKNVNTDTHYQSFSRIDEIFSLSGRPAPGFLTTHDNFAIAFTKKEITNNVEELIETKSEKEARKLFQLCKQKQWVYENAKESLKKDQSWKKQVRQCLYRPFDFRWTVYNPNVLVHRRERVNSHLLESGNLAILVSRMTKGDAFNHAFVTDKIAEVISLSSKTSANAFVFPLYLRDNKTSVTLEVGSNNVNISPEVIKKYKCFNTKNDLASSIFNYIYAILNSPSYRIRYNDTLIRDFPRIPFPKESTFFVKLSEIGSLIVQAHLLNNSEKSISLLKGEGSNIVEAGMPKYILENKKLFINKNQYFENISNDIWEYKVGSYMVCKKWLSVRKKRQLTDEEVTVFTSIINSIKTTLKLQFLIDKVIDEHGGWPGAFVTDKGGSA